MSSQPKSGSFSVADETSAISTVPQEVAKRPENSNFLGTERTKFDIRDHLDKLTPAKGKNRYICPVCEGNNMTIDPNTGKYQCWSKCECKDIREAVAPWEQVKGKNYQPSGSRKPILKKKATKATPIPEGQQELARLPKEVINHPKKRKQGEQVKIKYDYSPSQWVERVEWPDSSKTKGYDKKAFPYHLDATGIPVQKKGNAPWNPYRFSEAQKYGAGKWVIGVEGEPCVEAVRALQLAAITFQGAAWTEEELTRCAQLCKEANFAGLFYIPDNDEAGRKKAAALGKACAKAQLPFIILSPTTLWNDCPEKGDIADWIDWLKWTMEENWSIEKARENLENLFRATIEQQQKQQSEKKSGGNKKNQSESKILERYGIMEAFWGNRLRLNELKNIIELDGKPLRLDTIQIAIALEMGIDVPKEEAIATCFTLAERNAYNPVRDYLEDCYKNHEPIDIDNLATRWLGTTDRLSNIYLKRYLIAAVARIYEPGCQMDNSLILQGGQGLKKSTLFRVLHQGSEIQQPHKVWFDDTMHDVSNKDERDKLHRFWCLEWAELERVLRKGDDLVKAFLTTKSDTYRPPYGREPVTKLRMSVIVGTTNRDEFLSDDSGDRRYWTIKIAKQIDIAQVEAERHRVWAAAVAAYKSNEQWHLTDEEQRLSTAANSEFHTSDAWQDYVVDYIHGLSQCTTSQILEKALDFDKSRQDRASQMRVASILSRLGWERKKINHQGSRVQGWVAPKRFCDNNPSPSQTVSPVSPVSPKIPEVRHLSNDAESITSDIAVSPVSPFSETFPEKKESESPLPVAMFNPQESLEGVEVSQVSQEELNPLPLECSEGVSPPVSPPVSVVSPEGLLKPNSSQSDVTVASASVTPKPKKYSPLAMEILRLCSGHLLNDLQKLRNSTRKEDMRSAWDEMSPVKQEKVRKMIEHLNSLKLWQFKGCETIGNLINGKMEFIQPDDFVIKTDDLHSSQLDPECNQKQCYVKIVGTDWEEGVAVLESSLEAWNRNN